MHTSRYLLIFSTLPILLNTSLVYARLRVKTPKFINYYSSMIGYGMEHLSCNLDFV